MVITNLFLSEFPIINYDIGDGAETIDNNGVEYLTEIKGRLNDWIVLEDGRKYDYHPFYAATEKIEEIIHFRVIQETYHDIILEIVPTSFINLDRYSIEKKIIYVLRSTIKDYEMNYQFVWKEKIEADVNGKSRFIVNKIS
jgi:phenylacetate-coenzyme A ligase PaaK-like adenylate-forming protein